MYQNRRESNKKTMLRGKGGCILSLIKAAWVVFLE
jgi:hypothetical protein